MPETTAPDAETKPPAMPLAGLPPGAALAIEAVRGTGTAGLVALVLYNFLSAQIGDVTSRLDQVDASMSRMDERLNGRLDLLDARVQDLSVKLAKLEGEREATRK